MQVRRAVVVKLYRSAKTKRLDRQRWIASQIYNYSIALIRRYYKFYEKHLNVNKLQKHLTKVKKQASHAHWNELGSQAVQDVAQRIQRGYDAFFKNIKLGGKRRVSPPTFKSVRRYQSFTLKQAG